MIGKHTILDVKVKPGKSWTTWPDEMEHVFRYAARMQSCKVIGSNFHTFPVTDGYTGILVLAESHISVHTWPEHQYLAIDVFMCGKSDSEAAARTIIECMGDEVDDYTLKVIERDENLHRDS